MKEGELGHASIGLALLATMGVFMLSEYRLNVVNDGGVNEGRWEMETEGEEGRVTVVGMYNK